MNKLLAVWKMWPNLLDQKYTYSKFNDWFRWYGKLRESDFFCSVILVDDSWWLFWAHLNPCLIHTLDSTTNTTMGKSKHLSERAHYWFEQLREVTRSHFKAVTGLKINSTHNCIKCMAQLRHCHDEEEHNVRWFRYRLLGVEESEEFVDNTHFFF